MAKNRDKPKPGSHKQKQERLAEAKERKRKQEEAETSYRRLQAEARERHNQSLLNSRKNRKIEDVIESIWNCEDVGHLTGKAGHIHNLFKTLTDHRHLSTLKQELEESPAQSAGVSITPQTINRAALKILLAKSKNLLLTLERNRCKFWDRPANEVQQYVQSITNLVRKHQSWIREPETWCVSTKNAGRQFADLIRHLVAKYPIPTFMDEAWNGMHNQRIDWWIHVAHGGNIRTAPNLPTPLTKMMAHRMMEAPSNYSINAAIRWGQIHALGGNERTVRGLLDSRLCTMGDFAHDEFWISVFRWLIANPMLDPAQYSPMIDYIWNQKYVTPIGANAPPQPGFNIKDRQANTLIRLVEEWHERLQREGRASARQRNAASWKHHERFQDFQVAYGPENNQTFYQVVQLLTSRELYNEGSRLSHCVGSYSHSCAAGRISIWSTRKLSHPTASSHELLGTIEVDNAQNRIIQFRSKNNSKPSEMAYKTLNQWAGINSLSISGWL